MTRQKEAVMSRQEKERQNKPEANGGKSGRTMHTWTVGTKMSTNNVIYMKKLLWLTAAAALLSLQAAAGQTSAAGILDVLKDAVSEETEKSDSTKADNDGKKSYADVITSEAETSKGLMDIHKVKDKYYLEIPYTLMGKPMLLASKVSSISDNADVIAGQMPTDPLLVEWSCDEENVYLLDADVRAVCDSTESIYKGVVLNYMKPVMKSFSIKAVNTDSTAVVIDVSKFFCANEQYMSPFIPASPFDAIFGGPKLKGSFEPDMSAILSFNAFPKNIVFKTRMVYTVSDAPFTAIMSVSMIRLPDTPMRPRYADHRIGYFTNSQIEYSENKDRSEILRYINRWNLAPKPEDMEKYKNGELVEPEKPIVYYVDDAFPEKWRKYLKEGIEDWQMAFEEIGFKNAIVARDYPKDDPDFNPDDIRYSCLRYASTRIANAMGPSWTDPRSGEIINGSVYFYHDVLKLLHNWCFIQTSVVNPEARKETFETDLMGPLLRYLVVHEIGHTLGLMHNMRASYAYPVDSLRSASFTDKYGTTPSVMDYARYNYVAQPGDGVKWLFPPRLGVYDKFAIAWGYKPIFEAATPEDEKPVLNKWILDKGNDPMYRYGEQEIFTYIDPASQSESLGDDAVKASEYGIRNLKVIMKNLVDWTAKEGESYDYTKEMYKEVMTQFRRYMGHVTKYIGGNYLEYPVYGDGKPGFIPVSKEKQQEALEFAFNQISELPEWMMDKKLLGLFDPANPEIYDYQASTVRSLLTLYPKVGYTAKFSDEPYTQEEYIEDVYRLVFGKTIRGKKLDRADMNMEYALVYGLFDNLDLLESSGSKSFNDNAFYVDDSQGWPCSHIECRQAMEDGLAKAKRESDLKISAKEILFGTLLDIQEIVNKRAASAKGELGDHYRYLAHEINGALKNL